VAAPLPLPLRRPAPRAHHRTFKDRGRDAHRPRPKDLLAEVRSWVGTAPAPQSPPQGIHDLSIALAPDPCGPTAAVRRAALIAGRALALNRATQNFFPDVNAWLDRLPDNPRPGGHHL